MIKNGQNLHLDSASEDASIFILITRAHTCIKIEPSEQNFIVRVTWYRNIQTDYFTFNIRDHGRKLNLKLTDADREMDLDSTIFKARVRPQGTDLVRYVNKGKKMQY